MRWTFSSAICVWMTSSLAAGWSFSFTFVPLLLFNVVKTGFNFVVGAYDTLSNLFHFSREEKEMVEYLSDQQQRKQQAQNQTNGFLPGC